MSANPFHAQVYVLMNGGGQLNSLGLAAALMTSQGIMLIARHVLGPVGDRFWAAMWILAATVSPRRTPKVSIHVPAYAEPPHLVIATLDAISRLRYPDFEVLCSTTTLRIQTCGHR